MTKKTFTKVDITREMTNLSNYKQYEIKPLVDDFFTALRHLLMKDEADTVRIEVRNFGTFKVKPTKAKPKARNPRTNEIVYVKPHKKLILHPAKY